MDADLDDLEESVRCVSFGSLDLVGFLTDQLLSRTYSIVEQTGPRMFGLDEAEVIQRRQYVRRVRKEVEVRPSPLPACVGADWTARVEYEGRGVVVRGA